MVSYTSFICIYIYTHIQMILAYSYKVFRPMYWKAPDVLETPISDPHPDMRFQCFQKSLRLISLQWGPKDDRKIRILQTMLVFANGSVTDRWKTHILLKKLMLACKFNIAATLVTSVV